jgi:hypothetical protein
MAALSLPDSLIEASSSAAAGNAALKASPRTSAERIATREMD